MQQTNISLPVNWKIIVFMVILELLTIPFVAVGNDIVIAHQNYIVIMGFIVAFFALLVILKLIVHPIKLYFSRLINQQIIRIEGIFYICLLSGFLLMFMFYLQEVTYRFTRSDYIVGLVSAFFSVSVSLIIYAIVEKAFNYGIKIITRDKHKYILTFAPKEILLITLLFSVYETIASPLSILWVPHLEHRFLWGIISAIAAGIVGSVAMVIICTLTGYKISIGLKDAVRPLLNPQ